VHIRNIHTYQDSEQNMPFKKLYKSRRNPFTRKSRPARFASRKTKTQTIVNKAVAKVIGKVSENKINDLNTIRHMAPIPIHDTVSSSSPTYMFGAVVGKKPSGWTSGLQSGASQYADLGSFEWPRGEDADERIGDYMFARSTSIRMNIMPLENIDPQRGNPPMRYRMVVFKAKQRVRTPSNPSDPTTDLFLNTSGKKFGHGVQTTEFQDLWMSSLNKMDYTILQDKKFTMASPMSTWTSAPPVQYGFTNDHTGSHGKDLSLRIPYNKKIKFENVTNLPEDLNMATGILVFAQALGNHKTNSELWETNLQGLTSFLDG